MKANKYIKRITGIDGIYNQPCPYLHPFIFNSSDASTIYISYHDLFKSVNRGNKFEKLASTDMPDKYQPIIAIAVAPSDSNVIYVAYCNPTWSENLQHRLYMSVNGGIEWIDITQGLTGVQSLNI